MSRLVSEVWLQCCQLSSHAFSLITFLTHHILIPASGFYCEYVKGKNLKALLESSDVYIIAS